MSGRGDNMTQFLCGATAMVFFAAALCASAGGATVPEQPKEVTVAGIVRAMEDDDGAIVSVKIKVDDKTAYNVTMDEKGKKLGDEMWSSKVEVTGQVSVKDNEQWLTVKSYKEFPEEVKKATEEKEEPKPPVVIEEKPEMKEAPKAPVIIEEKPAEKTDK